jgi:hypothetical protein
VTTLATVCCRGEIVVEAQQLVADPLRGPLIQVVSKCAHCKRSVGAPAMVGQKQGRPCTYSLDVTQQRGTPLQRLASEVAELGQALEVVVGKYGQEALRQLNVWEFLHEFRALRDGTEGLQAIAEKELERLKRQMQRYIGRLETDHLEAECRRQRRQPLPVAMYMEPASSDFATPSQASKVAQE